MKKLRSKLWSIALIPLVLLSMAGIFKPKKDLEGSETEM